MRMRNTPQAETFSRRKYYQYFFVVFSNVQILYRDYMKIIFYKEVQAKIIVVD